MDGSEILDFWLEEVGPEGWYLPAEDLDRTVLERFGGLWESVRAGGIQALGWGCSPKTVLAKLILADQFPRNMFRGSAKSFATDDIALCLAKKSISRDFDLDIEEPQRQFFYLPLMHSESLPDQDRCVGLMKERMAQTGESNLHHARVHREVIRRFGRFPYRNEALGRISTAAEAGFLEAGGYGALVEEMSDTGAAAG